LLLFGLLLLLLLVLLLFAQVFDLLLAELLLLVQFGGGSYRVCLQLVEFDLITVKGAEGAEADQQDGEEIAVQG